MSRLVALVALLGLLTACEASALAELRPEQFVTKPFQTEEYLARVRAVSGGVGAS